MFYGCLLLALVCDGLMIYAVECMPKHSFWQVVTFDSALLVGVVSCIIVCCYGFKSLRHVRVSTK